MLSLLVGVEHSVWGKMAHAAGMLLKLIGKCFGNGGDRVSRLFHQGKASFHRCDRRSSAIDEGVEHSNTAVTRLQNIRTGIAVGLTGKSASPTTHPDIVHRLDIANHCVAIFGDTLTYFRRSLIDCRNADQSAPRVYPDAIFRISVAHHIFALHGIELDENFIEVVG